VNTAFANSSDYRPRPQHDREAGHAVTVVACGTRVTIRRGILLSDWWIVEEEAVPACRGRVPAASPLGCALLGARVGDTIDYHAGDRIEEIRILAIRSA
jgi:transcription elongation GreA/GreB family factor